MNQFLHKMGMPTLWAMTDVYGLDDMLLDMLPQPVVALMLLFPINDKVKLIFIT
jgi:ubiquitin carboxyl-terminal hydrolase L3